MRCLLASGTAWLVALGLTVVFDQEVRAALWPGAVLWWGMLDVAGATLAIWVFALVAKAPQPRRPGRLGLALVPVLALAASHLGGDHWAHLLRFRLARSGYESRLARIEAAPADRRRDQAGRDCLIEPGPPLRVAFVLPGGLLDNFEAIVYDPTGAVLRVNTLRGDPSFWTGPRFESIRICFGASLVAAEPLGGPWYRCRFT